MSIQGRTIQEAGPIDVQLRLRADGNAVLADLVFTNRGSQPYHLLKWLVFPTGRIDAERFDVRLDGRPADYIGMLKKRRPPEAADFGLLQPGYHLSSVVNLSEAYDLSHGRVLSVAYDDVNPPFDGRTHGDRLRSPTVELQRSAPTHSGAH